MTKRYVLLNAPKGVGKDVAKDYATQELAKEGVSLVHSECKDRLHELTIALFGLTNEEYWERYNNRDTKELPWEKLKVVLNSFQYEKLHDFIGDELLYRSHISCRNGKSVYRINLTIREAVIYTSELIAKPTFGNNYFSEQRVSKLPDGSIGIDGSCGFKEELEHLVESVGKENILLIRIYRDGFTFAGDSRSYVDSELLEPENVIEIQNVEGKELEFKEAVKTAIKKFINKTEVV